MHRGEMVCRPATHHFDNGSTVVARMGDGRVRESEDPRRERRRWLIANRDGGEGMPRNTGGRVRVSSLVIHYQSSPGGPPREKRVDGFHSNIALECEDGGVIAEGADCASSLLVSTPSSGGCCLAGLKEACISVAWREKLEGDGGRGRAAVIQWQSQWTERVKKKKGLCMAKCTIRCIAWAKSDRFEAMVPTAKRLKGFLGLSEAYGPEGGINTGPKDIPFLPPTQQALF
ncbi:hypothetical protein B0T18DRAFT_142698 [Schizothecium vesticola]|uniref:Uncharacterized protein n=1 Tax=Schizothecium vesticola TaxID=314040 RepID=A0AA40EV11_9PEZI|nr:hypothetical protein B0T18DRAFT_142698 [Schizothecium vesticola]